MKKLTRLGFAKLALAAPFVVKAIASDGSREASAQVPGVCPFATSICTPRPQDPNLAFVYGPCTNACHVLCGTAPGYPPYNSIYKDCPVCQNRSC